MLWTWVMVSFRASNFIRPILLLLLWMGDQIDAETSTWQHTTLTIETSMPPTVFEPAIAARDRPQTLPRLKPLGYWDRPDSPFLYVKANYRLIVGWTLNVQTDDESNVNLRQPEYVYEFRQCRTQPTTLHYTTLHYTNTNTNTNSARDADISLASRTSRGRKFPLI